MIKTKRFSTVYEQIRGILLHLPTDKIKWARITYHGVEKIYYQFIGSVSIAIEIFLTTEQMKQVNAPVREKRTVYAQN